MVRVIFKVRVKAWARDRVRARDGDRVRDFRVGVRDKVKVGVRFNVKG
jgi:hypothetical protein